ncbi:MAG: DsbA family protein, partial [Candidatus Levybacteria bacterium]|nr:DsbA family protein [Candidatus Levybacteria bacterium]
AKVTIVEFSDFQCPFCARAYPTMNQVLDGYGDKVKLVYKHFPLNAIQPLAQKAAEASECAKDQGKFWEFHDVLFEKAEEWTSLSS